MGRDYYNRRHGSNGEPPRLTLSEVAERIASMYAFIETQGYLQRSFGYFCVDAGEVPGREGAGLPSAFFVDTGIRIEGSLQNAIQNADEVFLFTFVEYVHDHVAKPHEGEGRYHGFSDCGLHLSQHDRFDEAAARAEWREKVSRLLKHYESGYELSSAGEIVHLAPDGMQPLLRAELPSTTSKTDREKVNAAVRTFQLGRSTRLERKEAVRSLCDVLEFHRRHVRTHLLPKDASDLFNIANNFALRHHNDLQKDDYDDAFLTWLFYLNLATVHLVLARVAQQGTRASPIVEEADDLPF